MAAPYRNSAAESCTHTRCCLCSLASQTCLQAVTTASSLLPLRRDRARAAGRVNSLVMSSPKFETSPGPASIGSEWQTLTKPAKGVGCSSISGPSNCFAPVTKPKSATRIDCASSSASSTNSGPSTKPKSSRNTVASNKLKAGSPASSSIPAKTQLKSVRSSFTDANVKSAKSKNKSTTSAIKNKTNNNTSMKNANSASRKPNASSINPRAALGKMCPTKPLPNQKITLLPTPQIPLKNCFSDVINQKQKLQEGIRPNLSYAGACRSNMDQCNQNRQHFINNNVSFNIHPPGVIQSRAQPRSQLGVMANSIVRENIGALLKQHANGMSIFQLQKVYLFKFRQPLAPKGLPSIKQLLLGMNDVVKMQGVGVQMYVYPVPAEDIPSNTADRHLEDSVYAKEHKTKGAVLTAPRVSSSLNKKDSTQHQTVSLPLCNDQSTSSGQNQMKLTGGQVINYLGQTCHKQQILQDKQTLEEGKTKFALTGFSTMTSIPSTVQYKGTKMVEPPNRLGIAKELDEAEWPVLTSKLHAMKDIKQFAVASVQPHNIESKAHIASKPNQSQLSQDQSCNTNLAEMPREKIFAVTPTETLLHSRIKKAGDLMGPPFSHTHQHMKHSQTEQDVHRTITKYGPEHNASQSSDPAQLILHLSGFSIVTGKNNVPNVKEASEIKVTYPTVDRSSSPKDSSEIESGIDNRMLVGSILSAHTHKVVSDTHSEMLHETMSQMSVSHANKITQNTEHSLSQPHQTVHDSHYVAVSDKTESLLTKSYHKLDDSQGRSRQEQVEYPFSQPQKNMTNTVLRNFASPEPETQLKRINSLFEHALLQTGSSSLHPHDKVHYLQTTGVFGKTGSPSSSIEHKVPNDQAINIFGQKVSPQLQQKVVNYLVANESKQAGAMHSHSILDHLPMENVLGQTGTSFFNSQEAVSSSQTMTNFQQTVAVASQSEQKVNNSKITNEHRQTESVNSQSQDHVLGLQTKNVSGIIGTQSSDTPNSNVLGQVTAPASHIHEKTPDWVTENAHMQNTSLALQSSEIVLDIQNKNTIGITSSLFQQKQFPSSSIEHKVPNDQAFDIFGQIVSPQLQQKVANYVVANESKQAGAMHSHSILDHLPIENDLGQTGTLFFNSQEAVLSSQTMTDFQQTVAVASQAEQQVNNSKITNEHRQTESVESQTQEHVYGLHTKNVSGKIGTQSSDTPNSNVLGQVTAPASHIHEKTPDWVTENAHMQNTSLAIQSSKIVLDFQNKTTIGITSSLFSQKKSPSSQQRSEIQHICNSEQAKLMSSQLHQKAPQSCISTAAQNGSPPMTQPIRKWSVPKRCDDLVSPPVQTGLQNSSENGSGHKDTGTWQTDKKQYCCIL
ncbi:uncharacterized protein LOC134966191 isoform X2 [Pseudophryne corroboree]|uniref:uncharacterized protein LOC134966191 isoform X2 n=1 Tax=Pseudophryne corroboree TaxID=495146 RepID=UPI003082075F